MIRAILGLAAVFMSLGVEAKTSYQPVSFDDLDGWESDDHALALGVFQETCADMENADWATLCRYAATATNGREFFELFFTPILIDAHDEALFTGYFEPELNGARAISDIYKYPLYRKPSEIERGVPWFTRAEIEDQQLLVDRGLALAYLDNPVDAFFLQVQGSGRIKLSDGSAMRVGYGGKNGQPYRSIGKELVRRGVFEAHEVSAGTIRNWVLENPELGRELLHTNPSFVFFREVSEVPPEKGPLGAMNRSITAGRTVAVDPDYVPLGAPVWIEKAGLEPIKRLMIAQDTGSAIKGAQRADIFYGTGAAAGDAAGAIKDPGRLVVLLPNQVALDLPQAD